MKVLLTGAAGFIGMHVAQILLKRGDEVVGIDNLNDYYDPALKLARLAQLKAYPNFSFVKGDIADRMAMEQLFAKGHFQRVINLAAQPGVRYSLKNTHAYIQTNLVGFGTILEGCHFTFVEDIAEGTVRVLDRIPIPNQAFNRATPDPSSSYAPYKVYNIGNHQPVELMTFIKTIEDSLGQEAQKNFLPMQPGDVEAAYADIEDLKRDVGFEPKTVLAEGIARWVEWYRGYTTEASWKHARLNGCP